MTLVALTRISPSRASIRNTAAGTMTNIATGAATAFAGDIAIAPSGKATWLHAGSGGGGYMGVSGAADEYSNVGGWAFDRSWALGAVTSRVAYHESGDLVACVGPGFRRYTAPGVYTTITPPPPPLPAVPPTIVAFALRGDIATYWCNNTVLELRRINIATGAVLAPAGTATSVTNIAINPSGDILLARGTAGVTIAGGPTFNLGAANHHDAAWDPNGTTIWIAHGQNLVEVNAATGAVVSTYNAGATIDCIDVAWWPTAPAGRWRVQRRRRH